jgi:hypothetical protein
VAVFEFKRVYRWEFEPSSRTVIHPIAAVMLVGIAAFSNLSIP